MIVCKLSDGHSVYVDIGVVRALGKGTMRTLKDRIIVMLWLCTPARCGAAKSPSKVAIVASKPVEVDKTGPICGPKSHKGSLV